MREIKFRAWDEDLKKMFHDGFCVHDNGRAGCFATQWTDELVEGGFVDRGWHKPKILMQYTGLKDKAGVEIYEGDVVLNKDFVGNPDCVAQWERDVTWDDSNGSWDGIEGETVEIIGNVHQNPNPLE